MNTMRCFISCILPCGSLDVIRIVHVNGDVDDISGAIKAFEIMEANPGYVLKASCYDVEGVAERAEWTECPKIVILSPDDELQRGKLYFLVPDPNPKPKPKTLAAYFKPSSSLKKMCNRRSGKVMAWRPCLDSISEGASDA